MFPPEEPATALQFMPNHRESSAAAEKPDFDDETLARMTDYQIQVEELACKLREHQKANG